MTYEKRPFKSKRRNTEKWHKYPVHTKFQLRRCNANVICNIQLNKIESSWNVMAHGDAREGKWKGNWRMVWVASTLHTTSEHGVSSITTADAYTSADSSRLNWRPRRFKWTRPFSRKTKSGFCACAVAYQTQSLTPLELVFVRMQGAQKKNSYPIPRIELTYLVSDKL